MSIRPDVPVDIDRFNAASLDRVLVKPWKRTSDAIESLARFADEQGLDRADAQPTELPQERHPVSGR